MTETARCETPFQTPTVALKNRGSSEILAIHTRAHRHANRHGLSFAPSIEQARKTEVTTSTAILCAIIFLGLVLTWCVALSARQRVRRTTLQAAWLWSVSSLACWTVTWIGDLGLRVATTSQADHLWYASAVLAVCPPIAVLGSRRPGARVWTWFILFPLLLVLGWPVITLWMQGSEIRGLQLETPQLVAYLLVLVMGLGNYCGTRFTLPCLVYSAACAMLVVTSSVSCPAWLADRERSRMWATGLLVVASVLVQVSQTNTVPVSDCIDRVWLDFFNLFGVVWGRRIQDRVNFIAQKEQWPARLELHGFVWTDVANRDATEARIEQTFRWLLRRFVDPPWIDERLGTVSSPDVQRALAADS